MKYKRIYCQLVRMGTPPREATQILLTAQRTPRAYFARWWIGVCFRARH